MDNLILRHVTKTKTTDAYTVRRGERLILVYVVHASKSMSLSSSVTLSGEGAEALILGAIVGSGSGDVVITTLQHHQAPDTTSNLLIKSAMTGESKCRYEGTILVDKPAQKTNAYQRNENLLLDTTAHATSKPALEILANDVRCTHGAVVKNLDEEELWYLATRGIPKTSARGMMAEGFLTSTVSAVSDEKIRLRIEKDIHRLLTKGGIYG